MHSHQLFAHRAPSLLAAALLALAARLPAQETKPAAPAETPVAAPAVSDAEAKLATALRSYTLLATERDELSSALAKLTAERDALAARLTEAQARDRGLSATLATAGTAAARSDSLAEQLRQTQAQLAATAQENSTLRTRLGLAAPLPAAHPAPTRPAPAPVAAPATPPPAETPTAPARTHTVADGDTLGKIARRYYGNSARWPEILAANRATIKNPDRLPPGATLTIP